jgi:type II secretion system protein J
MFAIKTFRLKRGFTLLEVLAAIGLFAVMTLGVVSTLQETNRLTLKMKARQASVFTGVLAMERLRRDFQQAYNDRLQRSLSVFRSRDASQGPEFTFTTFDTPIRTLFARRTPGVVLVKYQLEKDDNGTLRLLRTEVPYNQADKIDTQAPQALATGILKLELEFYDAQNDQWKKDWDTSLPTTNGFPRAIRLALETVDPDLPETQRKEKTLRFETKILVLNEVDDR